MTTIQTYDEDVAEAAAEMAAERFYESGGDAALQIAAEDDYEREMEAMDTGLQEMREARADRAVETIDITPTWQGLLPYLVAIVRDGETDTARKAGEDELRQMAKVADLMVAASKDPAVLVVREVQRVCKGLVLRLEVLDDDPATATYEGLVLVRRGDAATDRPGNEPVYHEYVVWRWGVNNGKAMLWSGGYWPTREEATEDFEDRP